MAEAKKSEDIGMKRGRVIAQLSPARQLDVIAEGLPILLKSADDLLAAHEELKDHPRAASILEGQATEELAKLVILMDVVRCPENIRGGLIGTMFRWFYDHLARLIYVDAQMWRPTDMDMLQEYVDSHRRSHSLEGYAGEYIVPNWTTFSRESRLYADIAAYEDGEPTWNEPLASPPLFDGDRPTVWKVSQALRDLGAFNRAGLDIVSEVWGKVEFVGKRDHYRDAAKLTQEMVARLHTAGLVTEAATNEQVQTLYSDWQMPMYRIDFRRIEVSIEELQERREAALYGEIGYERGSY